MKYRIIGIIPEGYVLEYFKDKVWKVVTYHYSEYDLKKILDEIKNGERDYKGEKVVYEEDINFDFEENINAD
jgi:hypothetical protein